LRSDHRLTGINQLLDKQVAAEWVPRSRLPFGNILKIARQKPDATRVAGLWAWNQLGRKVKKGEKGIRILAPIIGIRRKPDEEGRERHRYAEHPRVGGFRAAYVFDVSQTDGESLPELREISGDVGDNHELLRAFVEGRGIELAFTENIAGALGVSYGGRVGANISDIQIRYASLVAATGVNGIGMILRNSAHALREARRGARQLSS